MKTRSQPGPIRPHGAPAYYLGRPASWWLTALAPGRWPDHSSGALMPPQESEAR